MGKKKKEQNKHISYEGYSFSTELPCNWAFLDENRINIHSSYQLAWKKLKEDVPTEEVNKLLTLLLIVEIDYLQIWKIDYLHNAQFVSSLSSNAFQIFFFSH